MAQWYCIIQGQRYGPADESTLQDWVRQGRVLAADLVWSEGMPNWVPAASFPQFFPGSAAQPGQAPSQTPAPDQSTPPGAGPIGYGPGYSPYAPAQAQMGYGYLQSMKMPHRGSMILVFGILSWVLCCFIFGIVSWAMGTSDLRKMKEGLMDPAGEGTTRAGQILGMIHVILSIILIALYIILLAANPEIAEEFQKGLNEGAQEKIVSILSLF